MAQTVNTNGTDETEEFYINTQTGECLLNLHDEYEFDNQTRNIAEKLETAKFVA